MKEVNLPRLGVTMQAGIISSWLIDEGEQIEKGDYLFELETEKSTVEVEAQVSGTLRKIIIPEGQEVPVNTVIAIIGEENEDIDFSPYFKTKESDETISEGAASVQTNEPKPQVEKAGKAAPKARQLAKQLGVALEDIIGTGKNGLITEKDVEKAAKDESQNSNIKVKQTIKLNNVKKTMSENMLNSWNTVPQFVQIVSVNMDRLLSIKEELDSISINDLIVKVTANVVRDNLIINSSLEDSNIVVYDEVNVSVAVNSEQGLVVPVVKNADRKSVIEVSKEIKSLADKARNNQLTLDEYANGTITVSNLGSLGIETGTPIINAPQAAIIFAGSIQKIAVVRDNDEVTVAPMMKLSIAYDHRFIDGVMAAEFTKSLKNHLENLSVNDLG